MQLEFGMWYSYYYYHYVLKVNQRKKNGVAALDDQLKWCHMFLLGL